MEQVMLKGFVLMHVYDRLTKLLEEYDGTMHPVLEQLNDAAKEIYERIFVNIRDEFPLDEAETRELYGILKEIYDENGEMNEFCYQACVRYCFPLLKDEIIELELKRNYDSHWQK